MVYRGLEVTPTELLEKVVDSLPVGVWLMDRHGNIIHGNPMGQTIWSGARFVGPGQFAEYKGWRRGTGERIKAEEWAAARAISRGETSIDEEIEIECFDGSHKIMLNSAMPIRNDKGEITGGIIVNVDITDRVRMEERLREMAQTDSLTGAYSRGHFYELLHDEIGVAARYQRSFSLVMFDVDRFKQINDTRGHLFGDQVLVFLVDRVRKQIREHEHLARTGGDEFMIILPETRFDAASHLVGRILRSLANEPFAREHDISCSFGVCEHAPGEEADSLVERVDQELYKAKSNRKNTRKAHS
jgi:diguanylate cyclase (GGDEF)-like protein